MTFANLRFTAILVTLALLAALTYDAPVQVEAAGTPTPEPCVLVGDTGATKVYRCMDWEMGKIIYVNGFGFLFVVDE